MMQFYRFFYLSILCVALLAPFQGSAQYQINGNAAQTACNCYRLTAASNTQSGSVWNVNLLNLSNPFNFTFDVYLGCNDGGADGLAFVLQPLSVNAGSSGGGIGYAGISPSLAVELDTYQNGGEPAYDHMALQRNGVVGHNGPNTLTGPVPITPTSANVEDCAWHQLNVVWDPTTNTFTVYFDGALRMTYTGDIINNIFGGNPNVYWGFTAATGGANNLHQFCNALDPAFIITSPVQCVGFPIDFESASAVATGQITDFQWDFGDGTTGSGGQVSHSYTAAGTFTVTLTIFSEGCSESSAVQVTVNPLPTISLGIDEAICDGETIPLTATGLVGGETIQWTPTTGLDNLGITNPNATPTATTTYTLGVVDGNGCANSDEIEITVNPLPVANAGPDQSICDQDVTVMAAFGGVQYSWNPTTDLVDGTSATSQASPTATTNYVLTVTDANGCVDTDDMTITVNPLPVVDAGVDDSMCRIQQTVQLGASGTVSYSWSPTTGLNNPLIGNPVFSGTNTTTFTVTGTDANGCEDTDDVEITVFPLPVAAFAQPLPVCLGNPTVITDNSTGTGLIYSWTFGDGTPADATSNPTHTYALDGTYTIDLALVDDNGCTATASASAQVLPLPVAAMNITTGQEFCEHEVIQFMNESQGNVASVYWNFGNNAFLPAFPNATSTLNDPTFAYTQSVFSPFTVTLGITDAAGCYEQTQVIIVINDKPVAAFTATTECEGNATQFTDESTVNASVINLWKWDFGDAIGSSLLANPSYPYSQAGTYTTQLIVETDNGCSDTVVHDVIVNPTPVMNISGMDTCLNDETAFVNNSSPQDSTITSWDWDFGDGDVLNGSTAAHTYLNHGIFTVSLTATTDSGCVATGTTQIAVFPNPEPAFALIEAEGCTPHDVLFVNQSTIATGSNATYLWELGDGTTSSIPSPQNTYPDSGYYDITLSVTSTEGCNTIISVTNAVRANITPVADFTIKEDVLSLLDAEVVLTDASQHALTWDWNLGDGTSSTSLNPTHIYGQPGTYELQLTVTNGDCEDTKLGLVKVEPIFTFYIPSAFTPDDDGLNETFFGTGESILTYNMKITDRWGKLIFESNDPDFHWDGTYLGKQVEIGVYVYQFFVDDLFGYEHLYTGHVTLMR
jgi:gliding motility-associated-like protein